MKGDSIRHNSRLFDVICHNVKEAEMVIPYTRQNREQERRVVLVSIPKWQTG
jgi:hypothetical protein